MQEKYSFIDKLCTYLKNKQVLSTDKGWIAGKKNQVVINTQFLVDPYVFWYMYSKIKTHINMS